MSAAILCFALLLCQLSQLTLLAQRPAQFSSIQLLWNSRKIESQNKTETFFKVWSVKQFNRIHRDSRMIRWVDKTLLTAINLQNLSNFGVIFFVKRYWLRRMQLGVTTIWRVFSHLATDKTGDERNVVNGDWIFDILEQKKSIWQLLWKNFPRRVSFLDFVGGQKC